MAKPFTLGGGLDPRLSQLERTLDNKLDFRHPTDSTKDIRLALGDDEIEIIQDPFGTPTLIGTIPGGGGGSLTFPCEDMTAGGTISAATRAAICDETGVTLPAAPAAGTFVHLRNVGTAATVGRNGENIDGAAADYTLAAGASVLLVYHAATFGGWRSFPGSGSGGGSSDGGPGAIIGSVGGPPLQVGARIEARTTVGYDNLDDWFLDIFPTGSAQVDVLVNGSSITGTGQPAVVAGTNATGDTTSWSATTIARNAVVTFEVLTISDGVEWINLSINGERT